RRARWRTESRHTVSTASRTCCARASSLVGREPASRSSRSIESGSCVSRSAAGRPFCCVIVLLVCAGPLSCPPSREIYEAFGKRLPRARQERLDAFGRRLEPRRDLGDGQPFDILPLEDVAVALGQVVECEVHERREILPFELPFRIVKRRGK